MFTLAFSVMLPTLVSQVQAVEKKVKVFVLAGQSNMEGHGAVRSLPVLGEHPKYGYLLKTLQNEDGSWAVRDDVTIAWKVKEKTHGPLTVGWGGEATEIGQRWRLPESWWNICWQLIVAARPLFQKSHHRWPEQGR